MSQSTQKSFLFSIQHIVSIAPGIDYFFVPDF
jgi:hypothetical protein